jgi:hypothetical protein
MNADPPLMLVTIYDRPTDHPDCAVVRCGYVWSDGSITNDPRYATFASCEAARAWVQRTFRQLVLMQPRGVDPDPHVWEVWG